MISRSSATSSILASRPSSSAKSATRVAVPSSPSPTAKIASRSACLTLLPLLLLKTAPTSALASVCLTLLAANNHSPSTTPLKANNAKRPTPAQTSVVLPNSPEPSLLLVSATQPPSASPLLILRSTSTLSPQSNCLAAKSARLTSTRAVVLIWSLSSGAHRHLSSHTHAVRMRYVAGRARSWRSRRRGVRAII